MERIEVNNEPDFLKALAKGISCVAHNGARHIVNDAWVGEDPFGKTHYLVETLGGDIWFENTIMLFIFDTPREAQRFLNFEKCEFNEDKILNSEIIGE